MQVGDNAVQAIIGFEISSEAYYTAVLQHPTWPGGQSGITIGIGYDLGQHSYQEVVAAWGHALDTETLRVLGYVTGMKGDGARIRLSYARSAVVPFAAACAVFTAVSLPQYAAGTEAALANCSQLHADAFGALVSLSYNRGAGGWAMSDDRHKEMRQIRDAMAAIDFAAVPALIRAMKRLWQNPDGNPLPGDAGLVDRREAEAQLFETAMALPVA
jgi:GH24 family phage-related lysozyme (muramidase)